MNKTVHFLALVCVMSCAIITSNTKAQSLDEKAQSAALESCECLNQLFNKYHPSLVRMMRTIVEKGEEEAQTEFIQYFSAASSEEQMRIQDDLVRFEVFEEEIDVYCKDTQERYSEYDKNDEFQEKMIAYLKKMENCSLVQSIMLSGENITEED